LIINAELIEYIEGTPDTVITLSTGRKLVVKETTDEVVERILCYRARLRGVAGPTGDGGA